MSISFKAGRAERVGETSTVSCREGRGQISLSSEDGLTTFRYTNLLTSVSEDELILFPGDANLVAIGTTRVVVLKFSSSNARHFYWLQDLAEGNQDEENIRKVNEIINGDEIEIPVIPLLAPAVPSTSTSESELSLPPATSTAPTSSLGTAEQMLQLQNLINAMSDGSNRALTAPSAPEFSLSHMLTPNHLTPHLSTHLSSLAPYLPPTMPPTISTLLKTINSQDFKSSVASFDRALRTGALGPLLVEFRLKESDAGGVEEFLAGIQRQADEEKSDKMEE